MKFVHVWENREKSRMWLKTKKIVKTYAVRKMATKSASESGFYA